MKVVKVSWESAPGGSGGEIVFPGNAGMLSKSDLGTGAYYQRASTGPHIARVVRESLSGGEPVFTVTALVVARVDGTRYLEPNDSFVLDHATGRAEMVALNIPFVFQLVDIG